MTKKEAIEDINEKFDAILLAVGRALNKKKN